MRKAVFFVLLLGVAYFAYIYMIKPANANLVIRRQQTDAKTAKLAELDKAAAEAQDLSGQLSQLEEAIRFFESRLPPESDIHKVLEQITVIAQKQGLKSHVVRALNPRNCSGYIEQPLRMEMSGDFNSCYSFLLELEKMPRIVRVREFEMKKSPKNERLLEVAFVISVFFSPQE
jgi:type IV pilus assembly protein PilO